MSRLFLDLLSMALIAVRVLTMIPAYLIVALAAQIERLQEWVDTRRGIPIVQVGDDE